MHAIDKVNISMAWRSEHHGIARRVACGSVRSQIARAKIGFNLDDAPRKLLAPLAAHDQLAQQFMRNRSWIAIKDSPAQEFSLVRHTGRDCTWAKRSFNRRNGLSSQR